MNDKVNVLGTEYKIVVKGHEEDKEFKNDIDGYCDKHLKNLVLCDKGTMPGWDGEPNELIQTANKETLRHEITHAFLNESGLCDNAHVCELPWPRNEEMVDWIAKQGPKLYQAWVEAGAL